MRPVATKEGLRLAPELLAELVSHFGRFPKTARKTAFLHGLAKTRLNGSGFAKGHGLAGSLGKGQPFGRTD